MLLDIYTRRLNIFFLVVVFLLQAIDSYMRDLEMFSEVVNLFKNAVLISASMLLLIELYSRRHYVYEYYFVSELKNIFGIFFSFLFFTIYFCISNDGFYFISIDGLFRLIIPGIIAFSVINVMQTKDIYYGLKVSFLITFIFYMLTIMPKLNFANILAIDFVHSDSPFESNFFSPLAIGFYTLFAEYKREKILLIIGFIFCFLTFKRLMIIYAFFLLIFGGWINKNKKIKKSIVVVTGWVFLFITALYIALMEGTYDDQFSEWFGLSVQEFSMGRSYLMGEIVSYFKSYGYLSSTVEFRTMEMDLPMIYVEMGWGAIVALIYFLFRMIKNNLYVFFLILFTLFECLTSHWLDITYYWIIMYFTIGIIRKRKDEC
jgi:hypothetical protein